MPSATSQQKGILSNDFTYPTNIATNLACDTIRTYNVLTATEASAKQAHIHYLFHNSINTHKEVLNNATQMSMLRGYRLFCDKIAKFRTTTKIHKNPWKLPPVISKCGTILECMSKWLDFKLQTLVEFMPAVIEDSQMITDELTSLNLPKMKDSSLLTWCQCTQT
jgi:hypothetical protein